MIEARKDGALGSTTNGRRAALFEATAGPHERPRGFFSFLTWPFALAQLFAVEEFLGGTSRSAHAEEEQGKSTRSARGRIWAAASTRP
jgi:hypothetical protein